MIEKIEGVAWWQHEPPPDEGKIFWTAREYRVTYPDGHDETKIVWLVGGAGLDAILALWNESGREMGWKYSAV